MALLVKCIKQKAVTLRKISRVMVPIFPGTNPYSFEKRKFGEVSDLQRVHLVSGPVFNLNQNFSTAWNIRYPDTSLKRSMSRPVSVHIFLEFAENNAVPLMNPTLFASHFR